MKTKLALAITGALALTACVDDYELESEGSNFHSVGTVEAAGYATTGKTLTATITDNDGVVEDSIIYTWYKDNAPNSNEGSTYLLTDDDIGSVFSVKVEYSDNAGYEEVAISEFTKEVDEASVGSVALDGYPFVGYALKAIITDENGTTDNTPIYTWWADEVEIAGADEASYTLTENEESKTIAVNVKYVDDKGFEEEHLSDLSVPVTTVPDGYVENQVAQLVDTSTSNSGVLRVKLKEVDDNNDPHEVIESGKVSVSFSKDEVLFGEVGKEAYIGLMGSSTSTSKAMFDLRIGNGTYTIRNHSGEDSLPLDVETTFIIGEWVDVDITWDASAATDTVGPTVTLFIDNEQVYTGTSTSDDLSTVIDGVAVVNFKVSDTVSTPTGAFRIDDLEIYNDMAGTESELIFADDFSTYELGLDLNKNNNDGVALYNASTAEATVIKVLKPAEE